jgi:predicted nucleic acid-binding Zn ribbon protein
MQAISSTATSVIRGILAEQPHSPAKIRFAWQMAAGRALARAGHVECRADGVLAIHANGEAWRRELRRARPMLLRRLNELLGPDVVTELRVQ